MKEISTLYSTKVSEADIDRMLDTFEKDKELKEESVYLSRAWIESLLVGRSFERARKKIDVYLRWRKEKKIAKLIQTCLQDTEGTSYPYYLGSDFVYFRGVDKAGTPLFWVDPGRFPWKHFEFKSFMEFGSVYAACSFDNLPSHVHNINVIGLLDRYPYSQLMRHPKLITSTLDLWIKCAPERLKKAVLVTGKVGKLIYQIVKNFAPANLLAKIIVVSTREEAAKVILEQGLIETEEDVPDFLGGSLIHSEGKDLTSFQSILKRFKSNWPLDPADQ